VRAQRPKRKTGKARAPPDPRTAQERFESGFTYAVVVLLSLAQCAELAAPKLKANLVIGKELSNSQVVKERDLVIKYTIYNVGDGPASEVTLTDEDITSGPFTIRSGLKSAYWPTIPAGSKSTHVLVATPSMAIKLMHNFTAAKVTYKANKDDLSQQTGTSSTPGTFEIYQSGEFSRQNNPHLVEWFLFMLICVVPLGVPYLIIKQTKSSY